MDANNKWRYLSFSIQETHFGTRMTYTTNSNQNLYSGYYVLAYYAAETTEVQYSFYFSFSYAINRLDGSVSTSFKPMNKYETEGCIIGSPCEFALSTRLVYQDEDMIFTNYIEHLEQNQHFLLRQIIKTEDPQEDPQFDYYLNQTTVYYVGNGFNKQTTPISIDNSNPGYVQLELIADVAYSNITVQVVSYISTTTTIYDPVNGVAEIECIVSKHCNSSICAEQCIDNLCISESYECTAESLCPICIGDSVLFGTLLMLLLIGIWI